MLVKQLRLDLFLASLDDSQVNTVPKIVRFPVLMRGLYYLADP